MLEGGALETAGPPADVARDGDQRVEPDGHDQDDPAGGDAHVAVDQVVERSAGGEADHAAHRAVEGVEQKDQHATEAEEAGQGHHERRQVEPGDEDALERPDGRTGQQPDDHGGPPGPAVGRGEQGQGDGGADAGHESDREVDLTQNQGEGLAQAQRHEECRLHQQVDDVAGREEVGLLDLEDDDDCDQAEDDRQGPALAAADPLHPRFDVLPERVGQDFGCHGETQGDGRRRLLVVVLLEAALGPAVGGRARSRFDLRLRCRRRTFRGPALITGHCPLPFPLPLPLPAPLPARARSDRPVVM